MARPTKYTPENREKILELLRAGNTRKTAAECIGVNPDTFFTWLNLYPEFSEACKRAEQECVAAMVAIIKRAAVGVPTEKVVTRTRTVSGEVTDTETTVTKTVERSWQAAAWYLERRKPEDFARLVIDPAKLSAEQIADLMRLEGGGSKEGDNSAGSTASPKP